MVSDAGKWCQMLSNGVKRSDAQCMEALQVSRLRKNWIHVVCFQQVQFEKISDQPIRAKQVSM